MTATQAPTPGPLSGEPEQDLCFGCQKTHDVDDLKIGFCLECERIGKTWSQTLAPTAPVEASGSERDTSDAIDLLVRSKAALQGHIDAIQAGKQASEIGQPVGQPNPILDCINGLPEIVRWLDAGQFDIEAAFEDYEDRLDAALRPQPSGETRLRDDIISIVEDARNNVVSQPWDAIPPEPWDVVSFAADRILALLAARPLALGGQQGVGLAASEIGAHIAKRDAEYEAALADLTIKPDASSLGEFGRSIFGALSDCPAMSIDKQADFVARALWPAVSALSTTPARAEAQDEGTAGEPVAHIRGIDDVLVVDWAQNVMPPAGTTLYAHPSPTPAADADRVREAIVDVISHENDWRTALTAMDAAEETPEDGSGKPGYWLHQIKVLDRVLTALKSTAAKEGGEA